MTKSTKDVMHLLFKEFIEVWSLTNLLLPG
jgi:hypothetical protein